MILSINIDDRSLICLDTKTIRTVNIVNNCVNVTMNLGFCIDDLKIYTGSEEDCKQIFDRIIYCINEPIDALTFSKGYLRVGCDDTEEDFDE